MGARGEQLQAEVLAILRSQTAPMSAYGLLDVLRETHEKIAPPTVYRALAALTERGLVHRLESLNAFMACQNRDHADGSVLSICDDCGHVDETFVPAALSSLSDALERTGFSAQRHVIEVHGLCAACGPNREAT